MKNRSIAFCALWACLATSSTVVSDPEGPILPPAQQLIAYEDGSDNEHVYLLQEPLRAPVDERSGILIYMHGAGGQEGQGMQLFPRLRVLLDRMGWVFVCPRDSNYEGLVQDLTQRFGARPLYLVGASAGGRSALREVSRSESRYAGLVLLGPAVLPDSALVTRAGSVTLPLYMRCGDQDVLYARTCRLLEQRYTSLEHRVYYEEIAGGSHDSPCQRVNWPEVLRFLTGRERLVGE